MHGHMKVKLQMASRLRNLMSSGSKKKELRGVCVMLRFHTIRDCGKPQ